jgi:hypothetical protein
MPGKPNPVARLFWTAVIGGPFALWYGPPALAATGLALMGVWTIPERERAADHGRPEQARDGIGLAWHRLSRGVDGSRDPRKRPLPDA